jgi:NAD(P)-dependent dehydrogenase (short-subunit alcohol dehydrogenase family)
MKKLRILGGGFAVLAGGAIALKRLRRARRAISFQDKVVLVTGGSRGLGLLLAGRFGAEGARVVICARDPLELETARIELTRRHPGMEVMIATCDVSQASEVEAMIGNVVGHFGAIDVLVNNAGIIQVGPADAMTLEDYKAAMDVNYWGTVHASLAALPWMKGNPGARIVNITSIGGVIPVPHLLPYTAAKFAAVGFSEGLRNEIQELGIPVTTVVPGLMRTGSSSNALFKGNEEEEYRWFSFASNLPGLSMDASRAAGRIVEACRHGDAILTLGLPFRVARILSPAFVGIVSDILSAATRVLPQPRNEGDRHRDALPGWRVGGR